eukprot:8705995-Pyramimonas_sp.AAC.1
MVDPPQAVQRVKPDNPVRDSRGLASLLQPLDGDPAAIVVSASLSRRMRTNMCGLPIGKSDSPRDSPRNISDDTDWRRAYAIIANREAAASVLLQ